MRIIFFGTPQFAVSTLQKLVETRHSVLAVVTQPDRPKGRHLKVGQSPVKELAREKKIQVLQPQTIGDEFLEEIANLKADLFVVVSYGKILPGSLLKIPRLYSLNVHASLLPKYRGASPIPNALLNQEAQTGVTLMRITEQLDAGDILLQQTVPIDPQDDAVTLSEKLSHTGAELMIQALGLVESGKAVFHPQDESQVVYTKRLKKEDGKIDWSRPAKEIEALVRALVPWPSAYTFYQGKRLKLWKVIAKQRACYGRCGQSLKISDEGIDVSTGDGALTLLELQPESGRRMRAIEFASGYRLRPGDELG
jgi:methionyl-tRNA formyltransferase